MLRNKFRAPTEYALRLFCSGFEEDEGFCAREADGKVGGSGKDGGTKGKSSARRKGKFDGRVFVKDHGQFGRFGGRIFDRGGQVGFAWRNSGPEHAGAEF